MYCIYCGFICDFHESRLCERCRQRIAQNDERVRLIVMLLEAYPFVTNIHLREKIEDYMFSIGKQIP